jgi:peptidyl-prolyl cis-trans isomerase SurA
VRKIFILIFICLTLIDGAQAAQRQEGIAAIVNSQAITASDVNDRMRLIISSAGLPDNADIRAKVKSQVIGTLIEEAIKSQEAARLNLKVEDADIDAAFVEIAIGNKMKPDEFRNMLRARGMNVRTIRDQIAAQLLWMKVVARQIRPQIDITENDIDAEMAELKASIGKNEYLLSEIVLPVDSPKDAENAKGFSQKLIGEIRHNPQSFSALARQFSKAAGAAQGGDLGWVAEGQSGEAVDAQLASASAGSVIGPIDVPGALHIVQVRDKRTISESLLPSRDAVGNRLGLERLDRLQRRYYLDLRSSAFIETRV